MCTAGCDKYHIFMIFLYECIRIFICMVLDTNIFGYSFVSFFDTIIFKQMLLSKLITNLTCELAKIVHTQINIQRKIPFPFFCQLCFNFMLYHKSKI